MEKKKSGKIIIVAIIAFFLGALAFYGVIKLFPTVVLKEVTKLDKSL